MERTTSTLDLLDIRTIYYEPHIFDYARGREIMAQYPDVERIEVPSHWNIPGLHGNEGSVDDWVNIKRSVLVLGTKKSLTATPNERSSDFTAPSHANGCTMACAYCYVPRNKGYANPISTFVNIEQISGYLERHAKRQGSKLKPTQADSDYWVYEIGNTSDCSVDAAICDNVKDLVAMYARMPNAKATFATKFVNDNMLDYDPQRKTRIRFSLMPQRIAKVIDVRTSKIIDRIAALNRFHDAGYEVSVNFAPVLYYDGWQADYAELFQMVDDLTSPAVKEQLTTEVIFLTHNDRMHEVNMQWHPKAEDLMWKPELQEHKFSQNGGYNIRYKVGFKRKLVDEFTSMLHSHLPYCRVRYAF
jgi:spore photoproduct lyase